MSINFLDYSNETNWKESANDYYQRFIEPDIKSEAVEEIISWAEKSEYNSSVVIDYFNLGEDDEDIDIHEARDGVYLALDNGYYVEDLIDFAKNNDIEFDISCIVAADNGQFVHFKTSCLSPEAVIMEEARIALENEGFDTKYQNHEVILISPNGTEKEGLITRSGFQEKNELKKANIEKE